MRGRNPTVHRRLEGSRFHRNRGRHHRLFEKLLRLHRTTALEEIENGRGFVGLALGLVVGLQLVLQIGPGQIDGLGLGGTLEGRTVDLENGVLETRDVQLFENGSFVRRSKGSSVLDLLAEGFGEVVEVDPVTHGVHEFVRGFAVCGERSRRGGHCAEGRFFNEGGFPRLRRILKCGERVERCHPQEEEQRYQVQWCRYR